MRIRCAHRCFAMLIALLMLGSALPTAAQEQKVAEIVITGNENVNREAILNVVQVKPGDTFSQEAVNKSKQAIENLGFFTAISSRTEPAADGLRVIFDVVENPVIKEIRVIGHEPLSAQRVLDAMRLKPGHIVNTRTWREDLDAIQRLYQEEGYIAFVTEDSEVDREGILTIPILVHRVESLEIEGNRKTKEYVFLREMRLSPGDYYNEKVLTEDYRRIFNLDVLETMAAPRIDPGSEIGQVRVTIPVTEKKTGQVSVGLGYSSRQRLVGRAELTESNFRGTGRGLNVLWETGASGGVGGNSSYEVGYFLPWIDDKHTSLSLNVYNKLLYRFSSSALGGGSVLPSGTPRYTERHKGGSASISRPFNDFTRGFLTIKGESVETPADLLTSDIIGIAEQGDVRSLGLRMVNNRRDFDRDPAAGGYQSISIELGQTDGERFELAPTADPLVSTVVAVPQEGGFRKIQGDIRRYFSKGGAKTTPTDKRRTIAVRLLAGISGGTLPFFEQFFVGGAETLRGYREDRFWGEKMLLVSGEYRVPVANSLTGVAFVDYGDAWGSNRRLPGNTLEQHDSFDPQVGAGIGIRVVTPIGNLRLDYGVGTEGGRTHFSIGHAF